MPEIPTLQFSWFGQTVGLSVLTDSGILGFGIGWSEHHPEKEGHHLLCRALFSPKGNSMKRQSTSRGFTLVEMLIVITIISILAGLITAAAIVARAKARLATAVMEISQLDMAIQNYKTAHGDYPPDFSGLLATPGDADYNATIRQASENAVLRHLARAFPRYQPGVSTAGAVTGFLGFMADVQNGWHLWGPDPVQTQAQAQALDIHRLSPTSAMTFWLGGMPEWQQNTSGNPIYPTQTGWDATIPIRGFLGFSTNPQNPFDQGAGRIKVEYQFNPASLLYSTARDGGLVYWPTNYCDKTQACPMVYFVASGRTYFQNGSTTVTKRTIFQVTPTTTAMVVPSVDTTLSNAWVNPTSFQIFCSGADTLYGTLVGTTTDRLLYPAGDNYADQTFDDVTNFAAGKLEDKIPQ